MSNDETLFNDNEISATVESRRIANVASDGMSLAEGTILRNRYRIDSKLASGGFGITYKAYDTMLDTQVAVKEFYMSKFCSRERSSGTMIPANTQEAAATLDTFKRKFIKEAKILSHLRENPHIVNVSDVFEDYGTAYYVMDYIDGVSLEKYVQQYGRLNEDHATAILKNIMEPLVYIHSKNYLHLDLTPRNIMVTSSGQIVLIDFGVSKHYDVSSGEESTTTPIPRSPGYAPLEQYQNEVKMFYPATDIYALGAVYYFMLVGNRPPEASVDLELHFPAGISKNAQDIIRTMMRPGRKARPQSVGEVWRLFESSQNSAASTQTFGQTIQPQQEPEFVFKGKIDPNASNEIFPKEWSYALLFIGLVILAILYAIN